MIPFFSDLSIDMRGINMLLQAKSLIIRSKNKAIFCIKKGRTEVRPFLWIIRRCCSKRHRREKYVLQGI